MYGRRPSDGGLQGRRPSVESHSSIIPCGERFMLQPGQSAELRLCMVTVPSRLRPDKSNPTSSPSPPPAVGGACVGGGGGGSGGVGGSGGGCSGGGGSGGGGAGAAGVEVHRSHVTLQQAQQRLMRFEGILLLEVARELMAQIAAGPTLTPVADLPKGAVRSRGTDQGSGGTGTGASPAADPAACAPALLAVRVRGAVCVSQVKLGETDPRPHPRPHPPPSS